MVKRTENDPKTGYLSGSTAIGDDDATKEVWNEVIDFKKRLSEMDEIIFAYFKDSKLLNKDQVSLLKNTMDIYARKQVPDAKTGGGEVHKDKNIVIGLPKRPRKKRGPNKKK